MASFGLSQPTRPAKSQAAVVWRPESLGERFLRPAFLIRFVLYLMFATYLRTIFFDFAYDDTELIIINPWLDSWKYVPLYFRTSFWAFVEHPGPTDYYRPLVMLFLAVVRHIAGPAPGGFHLAVLLVHLAAVYLVFRLMVELTSDGTLASITAAIFGLHPTKVESVAWISGVSDSLCMVFLAGCIICHLRWKRAQKHRGWWMTASLSLLLLAMFTKEAAIFTPVLIAIFEFAAQRGLLRRLSSAMRSALPYGLIVAAALTIRIVALPDFTGVWAYSPRLLSILYSAPQTVAWYTGKQLVPAHLSVQYPTILVKEFSVSQFLLPLVGLLVAGCIVVYLIRNSASASLMFGWFVLTLSPAIAFHPVLQEHDRYFYLPSLATSAGIAYVLVKSAKVINSSKLPAQAVVVVFLCFAMAGATFHQASFWEDNLKLFTRALEIAPDNSAAYSGLVNAFLERQDRDRAEQVCHLWIQKAANPVRGWVRLAQIHRERGDYAGARAAIQQALRYPMAPWVKAQPLEEMGKIAEAEDNPADAEEWYRRAILAAPRAALLHYAMARVLREQGKLEEAEKEAQLGKRLRDQLF